MRRTYHLIPAARWSAVAGSERYAASSLETEGFVHCTDGVDAMVATANRHYGADSEPFMVLTVDLDALDVPWRYDDPGSPYPHIYGAIARSAILGATPIERDAEGRFLRFDP